MPSEADTQTSYDPSLPGKIRQELSRQAFQALAEELPAPLPSRRRFMLIGSLTAIVVTAFVIRQGWLHARPSGDLIEKAQDHFNRGEGKEALAILARQPQSALRDEVARTVAADEMLQEALDREDVPSALAAARALCAMPLPPGNWYRSRAETVSTALENKAGGSLP